MSYAPIIVFAFNRPAALKRTIASLAANFEAASSELFVFIDGPRKDRPDDHAKVEAVREYAKTISGFKSVSCRFETANKGLASSIIAGVTEVIKSFGSAIVVEDDLIVGESFLSFMNQGLERYASQSEVFSVCGYTNKISHENYPFDAYFCTRSSSWGWATWEDRWESIDWALEPWESFAKYSSRFNRWGGSDCFHMLRQWHEGKNQSWAIRFCFNQFLQNKLSLFPTVSHVMNDGFGEDATNCKKWSRFKCEFDTTSNKTFAWPQECSINQKLKLQALHYHSLQLRLLSRIMYIIKK